MYIKGTVRQVGYLLVGSELNTRLVTVQVATDDSLLHILQCMECNVSPTRLLAGPVSARTSVNMDIRSQPCLNVNPEDRGIRVLRNVGMNLPNYAKSHTVRP